jgi:hypothetical protein
MNPFRSVLVGLVFLSACKPPETTGFAAPTPRVEAPSVTEDAGTAPRCGDGVKNAGEECDGTDFAGVTCASEKEATGNLGCSSDCKIDYATCGRGPEVCNDLRSNDGDEWVDCGDPDCTGTPHCLDACVDLVPIRVSPIPGDWSLAALQLKGGSEKHKPSCTTTSFREIAISVVAPATGRLRINARPNSRANISLSIRTQCGVDSTEQACTNDDGGIFQNGAENLGLDVLAGDRFFVIVDEVEAIKGEEIGWLTFGITYVGPETVCDNLFDDDLNGYADCDDPSCQATADCKAGTGSVGSACSENSACAADANDPICLGGWPSGGYCSEFCTLSASTCAAGSTCVDFGPSKNGLCLRECTQPSDCRAGYACESGPGGKKVCVVGPEAECSDLLDNDSDGLVDCQDPDCGGCTAGAGLLGTTCTAASQCQASSGSAPICFTQMQGGYCSQFCQSQADCGPNGLCTDSVFNSDTSQCYQRCNSNSECRTGYSCQDPGAVPPYTVCLAI